MKEVMSLETAVIVILLLYATIGRAADLKCRTDADCAGGTCESYLAEETFPAGPTGDGLWVKARIYPERMGICCEAGKPCQRTESDDTPSTPIEFTKMEDASE